VKNLGSYSCLLPFYFCLAASASAAGAEDRAAAARQLIETRCVICHSADLIEQQRLDRRQWQAVVTKMRSWGAPLSDAEAEDVIRYLAQAYPPDGAPARK